MTSALGAKRRRACESLELESCSASLLAAFYGPTRGRRRGRAGRQRARRPTQGRHPAFGAARSTRRRLTTWRGAGQAKTAAGWCFEGAADQTGARRGRAGRWCRRLVRAGGAADCALGGRGRAASTEQASTEAESSRAGLSGRLSQPGATSSPGSSAPVAGPASGGPRCCAALRCGHTPTPTPTPTPTLTPAPTAGLGAACSQRQSQRRPLI